MLTARNFKKKKLEDTLQIPRKSTQKKTTTKKTNTNKSNKQKNKHTQKNNFLNFHRKSQQVTQDGSDDTGKTCEKVQQGGGGPTQMCLRWTENRVWGF